MYLAPTRKAALAAYDQFISSYQAKYPKATECLEKDKEGLFTFYSFPAQHWPHLRTTNPIDTPAPAIIWCALASVHRRAHALTRGRASG